MGIMHSESKTGEKLFEEVGAGNDVTFEDFDKFVKSFTGRCPADDLAEPLRNDMLDSDQLDRFFKHVASGVKTQDASKPTVLTKDRFIFNLARRDYRVSKAGVLTEEMGIKSKILRRLEAGEVLCALASVEKDETGVKRVRCRAAEDDLEGWTTAEGNQGSQFLEPWGHYYICTGETIITDGLSASESKTVRKVLKGEVLEALALEKLDASIKARRINIRAKQDGAEGYVTVVGNAGKTFLEPC